jgi:AcrR family transcriptional regulator
VALTQEQVVERAVELMAEAGLEALTLRRLATELGVSAPTLYWHVRNKRQLLDLMAEALVARAGRSSSPAHGQPWWDWLAEQARLQWRVLTAHRDAALVIAGNRPTETSLPGIEQILASLVAVGFPPDEALRTFGTRLSRAIPLEELLLQLAESLHKTMALEAAEVWTGSEGLLERAKELEHRFTAGIEGLGHPGISGVRGRGALLGVVLTAAATYLAGGNSAGG